MSLNLVHTLVTVAAETEEAHGDPAISPWFVGAIALGILLALLFGVVSFGGGREHS